MNGNEPAYPIWQEYMSLGDTAGPGLTKREWYAGMVLSGMCAHPDLGGDFLVSASDAVEYADALIAALEATEAAEATPGDGGER